MRPGSKYYTWIIIIIIILECLFSPMNCLTLSLFFSAHTGHIIVLQFATHFQFQVSYISLRCCCIRWASEQSPSTLEGPKTRVWGVRKLYKGQGLCVSYTEVHFHLCCLVNTIYLLQSVFCFLLCVKQFFHLYTNTHREKMDFKWFFRRHWSSTKNHHLL